MKKTSKILTISSLLFLGFSALTFTGNLTSQKPAYAEDLKKCDPEPTDMVINYWDRFSCSLNGSGDSDIFRLEGTAGDRIIISVSSSLGSKRVEVIDPKGNTLDSGDGHGPRFELTLEQTGTYTFVVSTGKVSQYIVEVTCVIGSCLAQSPQ